MKGDYITIEIPFEYFMMRAYYPDSNRWGEKIHIALDEEYEFKGEQVTVGHPICGRLEAGENTLNTTLKLMRENKLHIQPF